MPITVADLIVQGLENAAKNLSDLAKTDIIQDLAALA